MKSHSVEEPNLLDEIRQNPASRRSFLKAMGAAGLGLAAISLLDGCGGGGSGLTGGGNNSNLPAALQAFKGTGDEKIFNYALTLEFLEADLYRQALNLASGKAVTAPLTGSPSSYTLAIGSGGLDGFNTAAGFAYLRDFAFVENAHALFLQRALGSRATTRNAKGYSFGKLAPTTVDLKSILSAILPLEETGVRAYLGAGKYFSSNTNLQTAITIYSTEARHSSALQYILGNDPGPNPMPGDHAVQNEPSPNTFEYYLEPSEVLANISNLGLIL